MRIVFFLLFVAATSFSQDADWLTDYEKSDCKRTPRYKESIEYCKRLAQASPKVHYTTFGKSPQGRDLPLLVVDGRGNFTPELVRTTSNAVLLIQAGIHSGEVCGKDAGLMLIRDMAIEGKFQNLLDHVTFLFIPIFNVDGHERFGPYNRINQNGPEEMGWRTTAQNLNLNRDFLKADAPEMQTWLKMFQHWLPDFFVDCHSTDGADYQYVLTYGLELWGNMEESLTAWTRDVYLPFVERGMEESGILISPYVVFRNWHDPRSGLMSWVAPPRLSEGYAAIQNRPGLLIETHMLKEYKVRVGSTYEMLRHTLAILNQQAQELRRIVLQSDAYTASPQFQGRLFPVGFQAGNESRLIDFLGVEYKSVQSDLTGGTWLKYGTEPVICKIPYFFKQEPAVQVRLPKAYIIPPEWTSVIERLPLHGIEFFRLSREETLKVTSFRFDDEQWQHGPYEGRLTVQCRVEEIEEDRTFPEGSAVVVTAQRSARVAAHILEPQAPDSYLFWGFFNAIFEQKEYVEPYVMEEMARKMVEEDESLSKEFEEKKAKDGKFAKDPRAILNWFYQKTPYWDQWKNSYPVGKIFDEELVDSLKKRGSR